MKGCLEEGRLRAYHDRELDAPELEQVRAHLSECAKCEALADEVAGRAMRVQSLLGALPGPEQMIWMPRRAPQPVRTWPRWAAAAAALAAGVAIAMAWSAHRPASQVAVQKPVVREAADVPLPAQQASVPLELAPMIRTPVARKASSNPAKRSRPRQVFLALDDEPIETGVVIRVALGDAGIPADIVFGADGRAHAIRLVDSLKKY